MAEIEIVLFNIRPDTKGEQLKDTLLSPANFLAHYVMVTMFHHP